MCLVKMNVSSQSGAVESDKQSKDEESHAFCTGSCGGVKQDLDIP